MFKPAPLHLSYLLVAAWFTAAGAAHAWADTASVGYTAIQVSGTEWQYNYTLSGTFSAGNDLAITFPLGSSANLTDLQTGGTDWTTFALQPDSAIPSDGEFDLIANATNLSLDPVFSIDFNYSGAGNPGAQAFNLYDPSFNVLATGITQQGTPVIPPTASPVPEPSSWVLLSTGLVALGSLATRKARHSG